MKKINVLSIAASDTSGGAGIQRDLNTFHDLRVNGLSVVTGITAQTDTKVFFADALDEVTVDIQLKTLFQNYDISAVKIGVVFNRAIMDTISHYLEKYQPAHIVIDPILHASDSYAFLDEKDFLHFRDTFLTKANVITPNVPELEHLTAMPVENEQDLIKASRFLSEKYDSLIFAKGGHLTTSTTVTDYLLKGELLERFTSPNSNLSDVHGTGCLISSAITSYLALGEQTKEAIKKAKKYFYSIHVDDV
ncbi:MAG: hydroxymethylpyrimidine/phosphomethylpyrimidine kinase [Candidatus Cloacimonetes bacterium]|nr:hydroxymethylpyrimidine/phosphomethylpyrimidine kinase [Candidatus Cloacimonadota bacterium]